ncbi:arginine N-succinyltransferase [Candidatus Ishikawella capsulata]|uniref:Arginine succinyltransferase5 n=1 Tax=Candidatus Ishikawaella capsulata Mpkobe TaxID=476281 RepID=C5WDT7_9ENTR|nr:arginine N-succinyltransferase [Candidatus Ishikawaella capsulata]BAH83493.1 arginine succinyltransferase5 [Candidatus Ishikawaella capsulata Mpkobe]
MILFRPIQEKDLPDIIKLSTNTGIGLTSLPYDPGYLENRILCSTNTFNGKLPRSEQYYMFGLEDLNSNQIVGISAIESAVGLKDLFLNIYIEKINNVSSLIYLHHKLSMLSIHAHYTGNTELCTLFLHRNYQKNKNGLLLSKARFLFIACFKHLFSSRLIAEMRGIVNKKDESIYWNAIGRHFFNISFAEADYLSNTGIKSFMSNLIPYYPIYLDLLPSKVKNIIGKTHLDSLPAQKFLEQEGFYWNQSIDVFDAGPILEANTDRVHSICNSKVFKITEKNKNLPISGKGFTLISNEKFNNFRALLLENNCINQLIKLNSAQYDALEVEIGDTLRFVNLYPENKKYEC